MKGRRSSVGVAVLRSGHVLVGTGSCFLLLEDECGFLGHVRRRSCSAPAVAAALERRWSRRGLEGPRTDPPVSVDQLEAVMGMTVGDVAKGLGELMGLGARRPGSS